MIDREHKLPIYRQARVLGSSRGAAYYKPRAVSAQDLLSMRKIDELHLNHPFAGIRHKLDTSYILLTRGFVYLAAVVDWFSGKMLSWKLPITMDVSFCLEAVEEALARHDKPEIFNTDQGSQFPSEAFTEQLRKN